LRHDRQLGRVFGGAAGGSEEQDQRERTHAVTLVTEERQF
jgi:hypothetical protein